jgi:hypothetical protein
MEAKLSIAMLATRLDEHPASLGTDSVYKVLEMLLRDVGSLQAALWDVTDPKIEANRQGQLVEAVGDMVLQPLQPLFLLYNALSSAREAPGDCLKECLRKLEAGVVRVSGKATPQVWFGHPSRTAPTLGGTQGPPGNGQSEGGLLERIKVLEDTLKDVQDEMKFNSTHRLV